MEHARTSAEYRALIRWVRMCMAMLALQNDFRTARESAAAEPRKHKRW